MQLIVRYLRRHLFSVLAVMTLVLARAMRELLQQRTSFIIAHRLSTIRDADIILVMNKGRIVESGTHRHLLAAQGFYADLYHGQYV